MFRSGSMALVVAFATGATLATLPSPAQAAEPAIPGFTAENSRWQRQYEKLFGAIPSADKARMLDAELAKEPGLLATTGDRRRVQRIVRELRSYGLQPEVKTYYTYLSEPKSIKVEMTEPRRQVLPVKEKRRPWQKDFDKVVVGSNALSPSGEATAPVVYVNYGRPEDYDVLAKNGISVRGKIVLARYGGNFRGVKTKQAHLHGAKGVVIYSDPKDDGFTNGKVYPEGPWRAADGIQRGSVGQIMIYSGDPLTPGWPATRNADRLRPSEAAMLPKGPPTTPISYGAAEPLLKSLTGKPVPKEWQGGLPFTYRFGPGGTKVHMDLDINYTIKPIWDVTVRIPGSERPDQEVILGAHHDSWTYGSSDNLSGTENVLQVARGLGRLVKQGWRPKRTVVLATWDGEEYGIYGSTEYAEERAEQLRNAVAYINMDGASGSDFGASTTPALDQSVIEATKEVRWPGTDGTLYDAWKRQNQGKTPIDRIGGGSDFQPFFQRFGVPAMDIGSESTGDAGNYHCACDEYHWMSRFGDPTWRYHVAMSQLAGIATLRLANADVIAVRYRSYAVETASYLRDFTKAQQDRLGRIEVDVSRSVDQAAAWQRAAQALQARADQALGDNDTAEFRRLNTRIMQAERDLLTAGGLPDRPWYRHQIYAPGMDTGYATQILPALYDALFLNKRPDQARAYEAKLFESLRAATRTMTLNT